PRPHAYGTSAAMPSATMRRAAAIPLSGAAPHTNTTTSAPSAAASSTARRFSSIRANRPSPVVAGNIPPRHTLDTRTPASRSRQTAVFTPTSASLWRHTATYGTPWRAQASMTSLRPARSAVTWLKLRREGEGDPGDPGDPVYPGLAPGVSEKGLTAPPRAPARAACDPSRRQDPRAA